MIPKVIFTIWLSESPARPELIEKCIKTHDLEGYEHRLIELDQAKAIAEVHGKRYLKECLETKQWAKAADYLRIWLLAFSGGVYLDADVEILDGKNFDAFLADEIFCGEEENGFVSNAIIGSIPSHPILLDYLGKVDRNFIGSGDLVFQPGMFLWTEIVKEDPRVNIYAPDYFLPYNHHLDRLALTERSITVHHFSRSWQTLQSKV